MHISSVLPISFALYKKEDGRTNDYNTVCRKLATSLFYYARLILFQSGMLVIGRLADRTPLSTRPRSSLASLPLRHPTPPYPAVHWPAAVPSPTPGDLLMAWERAELVRPAWGSDGAPPRSLAAVRAELARLAQARRSSPAAQRGTWC